MHTAPNGKSYIGQTMNLTKRNRGHRQKTGCRAFYAAIKKYGWDAFEHKILAQGLTLDEANDVEVQMIDTHNTLAPNGYNLRTGGKNGLHSEESKRRQAEAKRGKKHRPESLLKISAASLSQSPETREKQRLSRVGKKQSDETKAKISAAKKGVKRSPETCANIKAAKQNISAETRQKISDAAKNRKLSVETKAKISKAMTGKKRQFSDQGIANIVAAHKGKVVSEETRRKMSAAAKARKTKKTAFAAFLDSAECHTAVATPV